MLHDPLRENGRLVGGVFLAIAHLGLQEDSREHQEHQGLHEAYQDFQTHEGKHGNGVAQDAAAHDAHLLQNGLTGEDVAIETGGQCYRADADGKQLDETHEEEDGQQQVLQHAGEPALGPEDVQHKVLDTLFLDAPDEPEQGVEQTEEEGDVQVGIGAAEERVAVDGNLTHAGDKAHVVAGEDEQEHRGEVPDVFACQFHPEKSGAVGERILRNFLDL